MKRFLLRRIEDETGVSGTGYVAEGVEFTDGTATLRWRTGTASTAVYNSVSDVEVIHGHGGKTVVEWIGDRVVDEELTLRDAAEAELDAVC